MRNSRIEQGLQLLREARNNLSKEEFTAEVERLCGDGNLRYPLLEAGNIARDSHIEALSTNVA